MLNLNTKRNWIFYCKYRWNITGVTHSMLRLPSPIAVRRMGTDNGNEGNAEENAKKGAEAESSAGATMMQDDDPYGVNYDDGENGLGPENGYPPRYVRDPATGKITGEERRELSSHERFLLGLSDDEKLDRLAERVRRAWSEDKKIDLAERVLSRRDEMSAIVREKHPDRNMWNAQRWQRNKEQEGKILKREQAFQRGKKREMTANEKEYFNLLDMHEIDTDNTMFRDSAAKQESNQQYSRTGDTVDTLTVDDDSYDADPSQYPSNPWDAENLAFAMKSVDPYGDELILPPELQHPRKVNRREATPLPKSDIHHNNLSLLRRYITPGGQIMPRMQTRLGAKDQRKVAKLVKRARALGIIPNLGQWKIKDDGDLFAKDLHSTKKWERVLERAGVLLKPGKRSNMEGQAKDEMESFLQRLGVVKGDGELAFKNELEKRMKGIGVRPNK